MKTFKKRLVETFNIALSHMITHYKSLLLYIPIRVGEKSPQHPPESVRSLQDQGHHEVCNALLTAGVDAKVRHHGKLDVAGFSYWCLAGNFRE